MSFDADRRKPLRSESLSYSLLLRADIDSIGMTVRWPSLVLPVSRLLLFDVPAELKAHGGQKLGRKIGFAA
jgi:hypothetical protein